MKQILSLILCFSLIYTNVFGITVGYSRTFSSGGGAYSGLPTPEANHTYSILLDDGTSNSYWTGLSTSEKNRYGADPWNVYTTMNAWEQARDSEPGSGETEVLEILGTWDNDDTDEVYFDGWTTGASAEVIAYDTARTTGIWSDSRYRLVGGDGAGFGVVDIEDIPVLLDGMQFEMVSPDNAYDNLILIAGVDGSVVSNCVLVMTSGIGTNNKTMKFSSSATVYNIVAYRSTGNVVDGMFVEGGTVNFYNVLATSLSDAFEDEGGTTACINCISFTNTDDFDAIDSVTYSASDDSTTGAGNVTVSDWSTVFADTSHATTFDFRLSGTDTDCVDSGTDLSGTFTVDIKGDTRDASWDIGPFEY